MASSRKPPSAERIAVALSGGVDSVVLLHSLRERPGVFAVHVHHGLSPNADAWASFCRKLCKQWNVPLKIHRVRVVRKGFGPGCPTWGGVAGSSTSHTLRSNDKDRIKKHDEF